jgi:DNA-binding YbaB/EbfC family protein
MKLMDIMKQAKQLQEKMGEMQNTVEALTETGTAGAGLVTVTLNGKGVLQEIHIDSSLLKEEEGEILEDLIVAAHADAKTKVEAALQDKMQEMTGGLPLPPGMNLF